ncbi:MAG: outer membrane beta-barrel protein [Gammaproteobacteria bacterium]|nr:outer membrane beta-barrel protein [Gammaproteobacteria bacterium]MCZ6827716.1 outer membrane beta-barrel protein [Gammaproteobacteria bacterium]
MKTSINPLPVLAALIIGALPAVAAADGHWYIGGAIGTANIDEMVSGFQFDSDSTSYRLYGGRQFNDYFALEAGYLDLGSFNEQVLVGGNVVPVSADADGFTFAAVGSIPAGERFSLHATIGSFFWDGANAIAGINSNVSDSNMFFGAGLSYSLTPNMSLRGDAVRYELDGVDSSVYTVGFQVDFK